MALWRGGGIWVSAPEFSKTQDLTIAVDANSGAARTRDIILRSASDPSKTCTITVEQAAAQRVTVVVSDWANTGELCNAAGVVGQYDCDGTYSVQYYRQSRVLEDRYPDGSGAINRRTEYRVGSVATRSQVDGQCGYSPSVPVGIAISNPLTVDLTFVSALAYIDTPNDLLEYELNLGANTIELNPDETIASVEVVVRNNYESGVSCVARLAQTNVYPPRPIGTNYLDVSSGGSGVVNLAVNHTYSNGIAEYNLAFELFR